MSPLFSIDLVMIGETSCSVITLGNDLLHVLGVESRPGRWYQVAGDVGG